MQRTRIQFLIEMAMASALAIVLDITPFLSFKLWAQGGSISFSMVPIFLISLRWGFKAGLLNGFIFGLLQIATGQAAGMIVHPVQGFIDYFLAFTVLGAAGLLAAPVKQALAHKKQTSAIIYISLGVFLGSSLRFLSHFAAGTIFFGEYAPEGQSAALYSFLYNISYMLPAAVLCSVILSMILLSAPLLARTKG